ncbi:MAG: RnfABCDGE type electron transport complex subunit D [Planctomycetes bacterium]|nr:RnfABCDGE type electron transport complex subunit D [Planctomycetota bacterium]
MAKNQTSLLPQPPYRNVPESTRRIMRTQLAMLMLPATAAAVLFGVHAVKLMMVAILTAGLAEAISKKIVFAKMPGSMTHSLMMGLIVAFLLPPQAKWYVAVVGALIAIVIAKHLFGGVGYYIWHPALAGRLAVQLIFRDQLSGQHGPLLARENMVFGDINNVPLLPSDPNDWIDWINVDWFTSSPLDSGDGFMLARPEEIWRSLLEIQLPEVGSLQIGKFIMEKLPSLEHCFIGAVPGGLGQTSVIALILVGLFLIYRGYTPWQLPVSFLASALVGVMLLPIEVTQHPQGSNMIIWPLLEENIPVGITYINYMLCSGGLFFGAMVITGDSTSRPATITGQVIFGIGAGFLTILFRFYTGIFIPCISALLLMNSLVPLIDGITCPKGPLKIMDLTDIK